MCGLEGGVFWMVANFYEQAVVLGGGFYSLIWMR